MEKIKNKISISDFTVGEVEKIVYSPGGLYDRVRKRIETIGTREVARRMEVSTQSVNHFKSYSKPKIMSILKYARAVGIE